jgi:enoyl-[acyl-carrier protein] reductase II
MKTKITELFKIRYPIIQGGMVWVSGYKLASAVSNSGGLGLIGSGSMKPALLSEHIQKLKRVTEKPFGVNIPLLRGDIDELIKTVLKEGVRIIFTSAGSPQKFTGILKKEGIIVVHVISSVKQAIKCQEAGCDAIVAEGFEAGGHNGTDELTTLCLVPQVVDAVDLPVIAAGGIADGRGIAAAFMLGAEGVQLGTRFAASKESSAHDNYKNEIIKANDISTQFIFRKLSPIRALKNTFTNSAKELEESGADKEKLMELLGKKREFKGIFEGNLNDGLLEAGQSSGLINDLLSVNEIFNKLLNEYSLTINKIME